VEVRLELRARASEVTDSSALAKSPVVVCLKLWGSPRREFDHRIAEREHLDDDTELLRHHSIEKNIHSFCTVHADPACATGI
jgi:hypothetical protein